MSLDQASLPVTIPSGEDNKNQPTQDRPLACRQCRARKVKCDRRLSGCLRCARLDFVCSYIADDDGLASPGYDGQLASAELTQAGTKRRRIRRACSTCRQMKAKCSGTQPCTRCHSLNQACTYPEPRLTPQARLPQNVPTGGPALDSLQGSHAESYGSVTTPLTTSSVESNMTRVFQMSKREEIREYIDAYFDKTDLAECQFLHRATVIAEWSQGLLDSNLLKAICASGLRLLCLERPLDSSIPRAWMQEVQQDIFTHLEKTSIAHLQTLLLLIKYHFASHFTENVWILMAVAARIAFTKRINYERPTAEPIQQESLRRLMWTIFHFDKLFSGGIEDLTLCPTERMHIRLPSNDRCFRRGLRSRSQFLRDPPDVEADMDALAYRVRLFDLRDRIFRYTRCVVLEKASPITSREQLRALDEELAVFRRNLPDELGVDGSRLMLMCHSEEARTYIMLHTTLHLCRCDLYRFLIPGIRESVSREAMEKTPQEYIEHCQRQCLESALSLCDFWSDIHRLETYRPIDSPTLAIAIYQVAKIVHHLSHLLPRTGGRSIERLRVQLTEAVSMTLYSQKAFSWIIPCIADVQRLLSVLGNPTETPNTPSPPPALEPQDQVHRRSKHAFAPDGREQLDPSVGDQPSPGESWPNTVSTLQQPRMDARSWQGSRGGDGDREYVGVAYITDYDALNTESLPYGAIAVGSGGLGHPELSMPLDPFDLNLNPYSDANVPSIFPALEHQDLP